MTRIKTRRCHKRKLGHQRERRYSDVQREKSGDFVQNFVQEVSQDKTTYKIVQQGYLSICRSFADKCRLC